MLTRDVRDRSTLCRTCFSTMLANSSLSPSRSTKILSWVSLKKDSNVRMFCLFGHRPKPFGMLIPHPREARNVSRGKSHFLFSYDSALVVVLYVRSRASRRQESSEGRFWSHYAQLQSGVTAVTGMFCAAMQQQLGCCRFCHAIGLGIEWQPCALFCDGFVGSARMSLGSRCNKASK